MTSLHSQINSLHQAYLDATGYELALNMVTERFWLTAHQWGITPDDVKLVVKGRIKRNLTLNYKRSLLIHRLVGDEECLAEFTNELAEIRAHMRKPVFDNGKVVVLEATGRETEPEQRPARHISEVFETMRKAT